jgi:hypothetical protein
LWVAADRWELRRNAAILAAGGLEARGALGRVGDCLHGDHGVPSRFGSAGGAMAAVLYGFCLVDVKGLFLTRVIRVSAVQFKNEKDWLACPCDATGRDGTMKKNMTMSSIRLRGHQALFAALGPVGFARFMQQFASRGDYTKDREKWIEKIELPDLDVRATYAPGKQKHRVG